MLKFSVEPNMKKQTRFPLIQYQISPLDKCDYIMKPHLILSETKCTYRTRHNEIRLWIEVATKYIITMSFQRLQTLALWNEELE